MSSHYDETLKAIEGRACTIASRSSGLGVGENRERW